MYIKIKIKQGCFFFRGQAHSGLPTENPNLAPNVQTEMGITWANRQGAPQKTIIGAQKLQVFPQKTIIVAQKGQTAVGPHGAHVGLVWLWSALTVPSLACFF